MKLVSKGQHEINWVWAILHKLGKGLPFFFSKWKSQSPSKHLKKKKSFRIRYCSTNFANGEI